MTENEIAAPSFTMQDIIAMVIRRKGLFLAVWMAVFIAVAAASFFLPRTYEASSLVKVREKKIIDPLVKDIGVVAPDIRQELDTISSQITAWPKLEQIVVQLKMAENIAAPAQREDFIRQLKRRISVQMKTKDIISVVYQDRHPSMAQQVANTLTQNFIEENRRQQRLEAQSAIDFINQQLNIYRSKLDTSQQDFLSNKIDSDLRVATNRRILLLDRLTSLQKIIPSQITHEQNPMVAQLQTRLGQIETELARLMLDAKIGNPRVQELREEADGIRKQLNVEIDRTTVKESISTYNPAYSQAENELKQVEMDIDDLRKRKENLRSGVSHDERKISEQELANLERNKQVDEDIYQMLLRQLESAYVSERLQDSEKGDRFTVIEFARLPLFPVKPKIGKVIAGGFGAGFALAFALIFLIETVMRSFQTASQVQKALGLQALGAISRIVLEGLEKKTLSSEIEKYVRQHPWLSKMKFVEPHIARKVLDQSVSPQAVLLHEPQTKVGDEYRVLRTHIINPTDRQLSLKTIMLTSTLRGEGKSTTSLNLSIALAASGKKTLLVDADLRKGVVHEFFSKDQTPGLVDVLSGKAEPEACIKETIVPQLSIFPRGSKTGKPSELLSLVRMKDMVEALRQKYDYIIFDTPPALSMTDASIVSSYADGVVLVVQASRTRKDDAIATKEVLSQVNARLIGFVLTNVEYYMPRYVYDYYYDY